MSYRLMADSRSKSQLHMATCQPRAWREVIIAFIMRPPLLSMSWMEAQSRISQQTADKGA